MGMTILSLVLAFKETNFDLYCQMLVALLPLFFANNNTNYARWRRPPRTTASAQISLLGHQRLGNPFKEDTADLLTLDTKVVASMASAKLLTGHYQNGHAKFDEFMKRLEEEDMHLFYDPIKKKKLDFFNQKQEPVSKDSKQRMLENDCQIFAKLFIFRECDLLEFFRRGNQ